MAVLIGMSPEVKGKNFELDREKITIGRNATNMIVLDHPTVSGKHCQISRIGNRYTLTDLGSTNGTRVNSQEIKEIDLHPKDLVQVGSIEFLFDAEGAEVSAREEARVQPEVVVTTGPATAPISFTSISPFGPRRKENQAMWYVTIGIIGLLALAGVTLFLLKFLRVW
ncbi:MAG: FHA domain-containing protein [Kiritimatiellae bacterium]|nr:FHA domain-containing protein [Kiritimatiellia bacterium]